MFNSIVGAIKYGSENYPEKRAVIDAKKTYSYSEYYSEIKKVAAFLTDKGVVKGDMVIIQTQQNVAYMVALHAVHLIGAVAVPLEKTVKGERVAEIRDTVEAKCFIAQKDFEELTTYLYSDIALYEKEYEPENLPEAKDDSTILFTTGTTGKSKGILMSHYADVAVAGNVKYGTQMKEDNVEIIPMPLNHSFSLRRYYANVINGSTVIFMDGVVFVNRFFCYFHIL